VAGYVVAQNEPQRERIRQITAGIRGLDIIPDHPFDVTAAIRCLYEIVAELGSDDDREFSCSAIAATSSSVRPLKATQSSREHLPCPAM
jgi:hypothetical protein